MNTPPEIPQVIQNDHSISYEVKRWDIFINFITTVLRNRILKVFILVFFVFNGWLTLAPEFKSRSAVENVGHAIAFVIIFVGIMAGIQCLLGLATAFFPKHRGLVGQHTLEITERGLVERTEYNESLHKWTSIGRIHSTRRYLYIYVTSENLHMVPKRSFPQETINRFESDLRSRMLG